VALKLLGGGDYAFIESEAGIRRSVDKICRRRDLAAAAVGGALDGRDHGDRAGHNGPDHTLENEVLILQNNVESWKDKTSLWDDLTALCVPKTLSALMK
jgi:hypothetical protein